MKLLLVGVNHRSAALEVRERLAVDDAAPLLQKLVRGDEIDEAVLLSTCNRVEATVLTRNVDAARMRLRSFFRRDLPGDSAVISEQTLEECLYEHRDGELHWQSDFHNRPRLPAHDIDVCMSGRISITEIPLHPTYDEIS